MVQLDINLLITRKSALAQNILEEDPECKTIEVSELMAKYILNNHVEKGFEQEFKKTENDFISVITEASRLCLTKGCKVLKYILDDFITFVIYNDLVQKYFDLTPMMNFDVKKEHSENQFKVKCPIGLIAVENELNEYAKSRGYNLFKIGLFDERTMGVGIDDIYKTVIKIIERGNLSVLRRLIEGEQLNGFDKLKSVYVINDLIIKSIYSNNLNAFKLLYNYGYDNVIDIDIIIRKIMLYGNDKFCKFIVKEYKFIAFIQNLDSVNFIKFINALIKMYESDIKDIIVNRIRDIRRDIPISLNNDNILSIIYTTSKYEHLESLIDFTDKDPKALDKILDNLLKNCGFYRMHSDFSKIENIEKFHKQYKMTLSQQTIDRIKLFK